MVYEVRFPWFLNRMRCRHELGACLLFIYRLADPFTSPFYSVHRLLNYPSQIWFDITLLPHTLDLPAPKVLGRGLGVLCHALCCFVAYAQAPSRSGLDELGDEWGDLKSEIRGSSGINDFESDSGFGWVSFAQCSSREECPAHIGYLLIAGLVFRVARLPGVCSQRVMGLHEVQGISFAYADGELWDAGGQGRLLTRSSSRMCLKAPTPKWSRKT